MFLEREYNFGETKTLTICQHANTGNFCDVCKKCIKDNPVIKIGIVSVCFACGLYRDFNIEFSEMKNNATD